MGDIKNALYVWCGKQKFQAPSYEVNAILSKGRFQQRFKCELSIDTVNYVGVGNSTSKKDAMTNAANDMCQYLVRSGMMKASDCPTFEASTLESIVNPSPQSAEFSSFTAPLPMFGAPLPGQKTFKAQPIQMQHISAHQQYVNKISEEVCQSEMVDFHADIHGGWTLENCKQKLNQFFQANKVNAEYKFSTVGPDHNRY